jgi:O-antigen biosynthesis protein
MAHAEIYVLNYNGSRFLSECLTKLLSMKSEPHTAQINVVDNCSSDDSRALVESQFPQVQFIPLPENYGFAKGNNLGAAIRIKELKRQKRPPDFHVFLNNDTAVDENWLTEALECFSGDRRIGIVGSKSLFYDQFVVVRIHCLDSFSPGDYGQSDSRELGLYFCGQIEGDNINTGQGRTKIVPSCGEDAAGRWLAPECTLFVPVADTAKPARLTIALQNHHPEQLLSRAEVSVGAAGALFREIEVKRGETFALAMSFQPADYVNLLQNAGSYVHRDWQAGDRGFLELDNGQFNVEERVQAVCGVSLFIRHSLWSKLRGFDEKYFAYYEDTDLSLRARLMGCDCVYNPRSILRHVHCGSSVEYSEYFNRNVTWSQLVFSSKMMNRRDWQEKLAFYKKRAGEEFLTFKEDNTLLHKPYLRAYCRYLKNYPFFCRNRLYRLRNKPEQRLFLETEACSNCGAICV